MRLIPPGAWRPAGVEYLEPNAWRALKAEGSTCVVAGPGAGKTEFLAQRAAYLLETGLCPDPRRILAISFKKDAARNLADRVQRRCPPEQARRLVSQTFDSFAKGMLDRFRALLPPEWRPTEPYKIGHPKRLEVESAMGAARQSAPRREWQPQIAEIGAKDFEAGWLGRLPLPTAPGWEATTGHEWALLRWWRASLDAADGSRLSFMMIGRLAELLLRTSPCVATALRLTYPFVFLDEFQDATHTQYALLLAAFGGSGSSLTAVGDDKQRIMLWAGARPDAFVRFERDFGAPRVPLLSNFRSSPALVRVQHVVAQALESGVESAVSKAPASIDGDAAQIWCFPHAAAEAAHLASWIAQDMEHRALAPRDYGLLVRLGCDDAEDRLAGPFAAAGLRLRNEARSVGGLISIQDLMAEEYTRVASSLLRISVRARHPAAWTFARRAVLRLRGVDLDDEAGSARVEAELGSFAVSLRRRMASFASPSPAAAEALVGEVLDFLGPAALRRCMPQYAAGEALGTATRAFALHVASSCDGAPDWGSALDACEGAGQVPLMTVHKSKGLEYHTTVFLGLDDEQWWSYSAANPEGLATFFVALSRAKQRAVFTFCADRRRQRVAALHRLLTEAGVAEVDIGAGRDHSIHRPPHALRPAWSGFRLPKAETRRD